MLLKNVTHFFRKNDTITTNYDLLKKSVFLNSKVAVIFIGNLIYKKKIFKRRNIFLSIKVIVVVQNIDIWTKQFASFIDLVYGLFFKVTYKKNKYKMNSVEGKLSAS